MNFAAKSISAVIILLLMLTSAVACRKDEDPASPTPPIIEPAPDPDPEPDPHVHAFGDWTVITEPTFDTLGYRVRECSTCSDEEGEDIPKLVAAYHITTVVEGVETKLPILADGKYDLSDTPSRIGYSFAGYKNADGEEFSLVGTVDSDVTVYATFEILPTTTFAELKERMEAGADIKLSGDIILEDTIFVADKITVYTSGNYTLTRSSDFFGDLFIVGCYSDGTNPILNGHTASLTVKPEAEASITIDGNKSAMTGDVKGTAILLKNSAAVDIYDGVKVINCKKTGNEYLIADGHNMSDPELAGGAAVIITNGIFNMHGGEIRDCEVDMDDPATTSSEEQVDGYNYSSRGGAIFNYGTFNMYGGVIDNCRGGRGGAIYNYRVMYLYGGAVTNNYTSSYGGAFYNPNSQYIYAVIGQAGTDTKMTVKGNSAGKTGGAIFTSHQSTVYVAGSTLFSENKALGGNGGAINAAGALVIDYAIFESNTASSKGGAIYAYYNSPANTIRIVQIKSGVFTRNEAPRGGAIGFSCGDDVTVGAKGEIGDVTFSENRSPLTSDSKYGYGAALHIDQASMVTICGSATFSGNVSDGNGGAIYVTKVSTLNISAGNGVTVTFENNVSNGGNAGAIYNSASPITVKAYDGGTVIFKNNKATAGNGGALAVHSGGTTSLYGVTFEGNSAPAGNGGALYVYGANAVIGDDSNRSVSTFTSNSADKGGAIYIGVSSGAASKVNAYAITATNNTSSSGGGAIYITAKEEYGATLNVSELTVNENKAGGNGGALYIYTSATVNISNLYATANETASGRYGGVAYISGASTTVIESITAKDNSASSGGCIYLTTSGTTLTINGGDIRENVADSTEAGNAIWVNSAKSVLNLKTDSSDVILLTYTEGEILGTEGFAITKYQEAE